MTNRSIEVEATLRLALEALELMYACYVNPKWVSHKQQESQILEQTLATITVIKEDLQSNEQVEPYCWTWDEWITGGKWRAEYGWKKPERQVTNLQPLFIHPPVPYVVESRTAQPKPDLKPRCFADFQPNHEHDRKCQWCAVETECKTGMTQPKEPAVPQGHKQEPACCNGNCPNTKDCEQAMQCLYTTPYVATPRPQRTAAEGEDIRRAWVNATPWRGLTDEEKKEIYNSQRGFPDVCKAIEAKLKEKNTRNGGCL